MDAVVPCVQIKGAKRNNLGQTEKAPRGDAHSTPCATITFAVFCVPSSPTRCRKYMPSAPFPIFAAMTAFISRPLMPDSEFRSVLRANGWGVFGQSFVKLSALPFEQIPDCDWLFFSSQNAVRFFFQNLEQQSLALPEVQWAALGPSTARVLESFTDRIDFVGSGEPRGTSQLFRRHHARLKIPFGKIVFPAARRSRQSVMTLLNLDFKCTHFEIYDNQPITNPLQRKENVLAFTSPMNAEAYFSQHALLPGQRVAAIGGTTDRTLQKLGIMESAIAALPNEHSLAEAVLTLGFYQE